VIDFHPHAEPCYRCEATAWETIGSRTISDKYRSVPHDIIACCFCGAMACVQAAGKPVVPNPGEFRFQFGRFAGMTLAEADAEDNGRRYLEHLRDTNEKLRERIKEYLEHAVPSA
jgi:hypothetical protein